VNDCSRVDSVAIGSDFDRDKIPIFQAVRVSKHYFANNLDDPRIRSVSSGRCGRPQECLTPPTVQEFAGQHQDVSLAPILLSPEPDDMALVAYREPIKYLVQGKIE
jgi:hypothetical protein